VTIAGGLNSELVGLHFSDFAVLVVASEVTVVGQVKLAVVVAVVERPGKLSYNSDKKNFRLQSFGPRMAGGRTSRNIRVT